MALLTTLSSFPILWYPASISDKTMLLLGLIIKQKPQVLADPEFHNM
jgi:hypothetical protein